MKRTLQRALRWTLQLVFHNFGWKLLSLAIAVVLWALVASEPELSEFATVRLEYRNLPDDLEISSDPVSSVSLELRGPSGELRGAGRRHPAGGGSRHVGRPARRAHVHHWRQQCATGARGAHGARHSLGGPVRFRAAHGPPRAGCGSHLPARRRTDTPWRTSPWRPIGWRSPVPAAAWLASPRPSPTRWISLPWWARPSSG